MPEIVTKEQYWIDILNDTSKFGQITTEDASFNLRANDVWKVIENSLLVTDNEEDVANWERITQLSGEGLTIFQRKVNILYTLSAKNYVPISIIEKIVEKTAGVAVNIEWDKENDKVIVHTDRADTNTVEDTNSIINCVLPKFLELDRYNHTFEISWRDINKYAACTTATEMQAVNSDYKNDLTSAGAWVYPIPAIVSGSSLFSGAENMKSFEADISHLTNIDMMFYCSGLDGEVVIRNAIVTKADRVLAGNNNYGFYTNVTLDLPNVTDCQQICYHSFGTLKEVKGNLDKVKSAKSAFFGRYGTDSFSLLDFQIPLPSLSDGTQMFNRMGLTKASVLLICDSIPTYTDGSTHNILFGIHKDLKADEEVLAAIEIAKSKGWTVTVQWNGTSGALANATTYSLRQPAAPPIYAMLERDVNGEFEDATSTRYMVAWYHELHSPDGKSPEELGYQEFASLEEALTTWGLTEISPMIEN